MAATKKTTIRGSAALLALMLATAGCGGGDTPDAARGQEVQVRTATAQVATVPRTITATGSLAAEKSITVSTRMMGWVKRIHVSEGQAVAAGDSLLSIDDTDLLAKRAQAEAAIVEARAVLANAQKTAERFERLRAEKSVSQAQLDDVLTGRDRAIAGVRMAEAGLREVEVHLSYLDITAPTDGVVARKMVEEGDMANPGAPLLVLEQTGRMKAVAHVGEKDVSRIAAGDIVTIDVSSLDGAVFEAPLTKVIPAANPGSRTYDVEALLDNADGRLRSGMFARMTLTVGERESVFVTAEAVVRRGQLTGVWTMDANGVAGLRWLRLGHEYGADVEVLAGLDGGETLIVSADRPLAEGDRVVKQP